MEQILQLIQNFLSDPTVIGVLSVFNSTGFILIVSFLIKSTSQRRQKREVAGLEKLVKANTESNLEVLKALEEVGKTAKNAEVEAMAAKELQKLFLLNSKASATTKNEALKIIQGFKAPDTEIEFFDEEEKIAEIDKVTDLLSKL